MLSKSGNENLTISVVLLRSLNAASDDNDWLHLFWAVASKASVKLIDLFPTNQFKLAVWAIRNQQRFKIASCVCG